MYSYLKKAFVLLIVVMSVSGLAEAASKLSKSQLEKLLGSVALYPDPLLAQVLPASTYPLQIVAAARVVKDESDFSKISTQDWDESVKAVAHYPDVLQRMNDQLEWTESLGQAVMEQEDDVLKTIQTLRKKAQKVGNLKSTQQHLVKKSQSHIEILPTNAEIIYVPVYDPQVVYVVRPRRVYAPLISYGVGWHVGSWFNLGFFWPSYRVYHVEPYWWRADWHRPHGYAHRFYDYRRSYGQSRGHNFNRQDFNRSGHSRPSFGGYEFSRDRTFNRTREPSRNDSRPARENFYRSPNQGRNVPSIGRDSSISQGSNARNRSDHSFERSNPSSGQNPTFNRGPSQRDVGTRQVNFRRVPHH